MPTYDYACTRCGHQFEQFQSMLDRPLKKCPKCAKLSLKRLVGAGAGIIFKGTGFYSTDYKKSGASPASSSDESAKPSAHVHSGGCCGGACGASSSEASPAKAPACPAPGKN